MTIKEEILKSKKIGTHLYATIARLPDVTDPDASLFNIFLHVNNKVEAQHGVSLNKLKEILDRPEITSVEGASKLRPYGTKHPRMWPRI